MEVGIKCVGFCASVDPPHLAAVGVVNQTPGGEGVPSGRLPAAIQFMNSCIRGLRFCVIRLVGRTAT